MESPAPRETIEVMPTEDLHRHACLSPGAEHLAPLAIRPCLAHDGALDTEVEVRKVEVRRERLPDPAVLVPPEHERVRLVQPLDPMRVEQPGELTLDGMRKRGRSRSFPAPVRVSAHILPVRHARTSHVRKRRPAKRG